MPEPDLLSDPIQAPPQEFSAGNQQTGIYDLINSNWNWTDTLGDPNVGFPPSHIPPEGVGFGPPWHLTQFKLFYGENAQDNITLTITGTDSSYGPTLLDLPEGPDGLTVILPTHLRLDASSVLTASCPDGGELTAEVFLTLLGDEEIPSTIQGTIDGTNSVFSVGPVLRRAQVWKNGLLMTLNVDCSGGNSSRYIVFLAGHIPQPGDKLLIYGWI